MVKIIIHASFSIAVMACMITNLFCSGFRYVESNAQYAESGVYLVKFRQLQVRRDVILHDSYYLNFISVAYEVCFEF